MRLNRVLPTVLSALTAVSAASSIAATTTSTASPDTIDTTCNPLSSAACPAEKALATSFSEDFKSASKWFTDEKHPGNITYTNDGLGMTLNKQGDNPTLTSKFYIMYGKVEVTIKCAPGQGIVSSFYLQSNDLDEIDLEWIGSDDTQFQSNFFSKGDTTTYDRGQFHGVYTPAAEYHTYSIDWAMDKTTWSLDGSVVRTLENTTSEGYPQSPMYLKMGIWAGGDPTNEPGTIEWAGGLTDYTQAPFTMYIKNIIVTDYSTGEEYSYGDQSGSWESINVKNGEIYGRYSEAQSDYEKLSNGESIGSSSSSSSTAKSSTSSSAAASSSSSSSAVPSSSSAEPSTIKSSTATSSTTKHTQSTKISSTTKTTSKTSSKNASSKKIASSEVESSSPSELSSATSSTEDDTSSSSKKSKATATATSITTTNTFKRNAASTDQSTMSTATAQDNEDSSEQRDTEASSTPDVSTASNGIAANKNVSLLMSVLLFASSLLL